MDTIFSNLFPLNRPTLSLPWANTLAVWLVPLLNLVCSSPITPTKWWWSTFLSCVTLCSICPLDVNQRAVTKDQVHLVPIFVDWKHYLFSSTRRIYFSIISICDLSFPSFLSQSLARSCVPVCVTNSIPCLLKRDISIDNNKTWFVQRHILPSCPCYFAFKLTLIITKYSTEWSLGGYASLLRCIAVCCMPFVMSAKRISWCALDCNNTLRTVWVTCVPCRSLLLSPVRNAITSWRQV